MNDTTKNQILKLIHQEVIPAIGCTEPIAVALAAAKAAELLGTKPEKIDVYLSANILKNAMGVGIPGTGMVGLPIAIALGVLIGKSSYELEVLKDVTPEALEAGKQLIHDQVIHIALKENVDKLYIEVVCQAGDSKSVAVIAREHTRFVYCAKDDQVLLDERKSLKHTDEGEDDELKLSFDLVYDFAIHTPLDEIRFILDTARLNKKAAEESVKGQFGHAVSKTISGPIGKKYLGDSSYTHMLRLTAAACDARMDGAMIPVMSNSGSGNQGIAATLPVVSFAEDMKCSEEQLIRASDTNTLKFLGRACFDLKVIVLSFSASLVIS